MKTTANKLLTIAVLACFTSAAYAQNTGGLANTISSGVNGFSNYLNGTSGSSSVPSQSNYQLQGNTSTPGYLPSNTLDLSTALQESSADCADVAAKIAKRAEESQEALTPDSHPGNATDEIGLNELLNMPISINIPAEVISDVGKRILTRMVDKKVDSFFNNQINKLRSSLNTLRGKVNKLKTGFGF